MIADQETFEHGDLHIDANRRCVFVGPLEVEFSKTEWRLLLVLARDPYRVCGNEELARAMWPDAIYITPKAYTTIRSHMTRLRRKLALADDELVQNIWGVGYRLAAPRAAERAAR
jgi:DNA-binding response OmpR family regulator